MGVIKPWAMNALNGAPLYDAPTLRNLNGATLLGGQSAMLPLSGCLDPRALKVDVSSDPLVTVAAGPAVVTTAGGPYVTGLDAAWSANLAARHATYARIDRVVLEVSDTALLREAQVRIITGTPTASPAVPALPTTAIALGRINVPTASGGQATVVDERLFTAAQGGIIYVPDAAARLRLGTPAAGNGYYVHESSTGILWRNSGAGWVPVTAGAWTAFTPVLQATTTAPNLGTGGQALGRFQRIGQTVTGWASFTFGTSGTSAGDGAYLIAGLPYAIAQPTAMTFESVRLLDSSAFAYAAATADSYASASVVLRYAGGNVSNSTPWAWGAGDQILARFSYETAS